jgi:imidazolonepropionase-like amidohydrolase
MSRITAILAALSLVSCAQVSPVPSAAAPGVVAVTNATVIDPATDAPGVMANIIVSGGRIRAVGPNAPVPRGAQVIDARGKYVTPGLWDMHSHLLATGPLGTKFEGYIGHGVLGVRDLGGHVDALIALRRDLRRGRLGPELVMAGPTLNGAGPDGLPFADFHVVIATPEAARAAVRTLKREGMDVIKTHRATSREAFFALADEAHRRRIPLVGHVPLGVTWIEAAQAGMQSFEHAQAMVENPIGRPDAPTADTVAQITALTGSAGDAIFVAMARSRAFFDPTLIAYEQSIATAEPGLAGRRRLLYGALRPLVGRAQNAGVRVLAGTDVIVRPGDALVEEVARLVQGGLTPRQALRAATTTAAEAALRPTLGRVAVGAPASFLIFGRDPTLGPKNLRSLSVVMLKGRVIKADELARLRAIDS